MIAAGIITAVPPSTSRRIARPVTLQVAASRRYLTVPERRSIQRRLDRWELEHLREHAAELAERLEAAQRALSDADDAAEFWREQAMNVELRDDERLGLTVDGALHVVAAGAEGAST